ncbi:MAG: N-acetylmuramoyl-L-alanine amidase [Candidatus Krumholzibacteriota bacterium]|nr:N-acetylmuramoyl-L-alanine amidase [Candidatus Krumholzibacteriota bacterium]
MVKGKIVACIYPVLLALLILSAFHAPAGATPAGAASAVAAHPGALTPDKREADENLGVVYADGRQTEDIPLYRLVEPSEELFISTYDLARIFRATRYWDAGARKLSLRIDNHRYMFTLDTRVVVIDGEPVLLRVPVRYVEGAVMIPLEFVSEILIPRALEKVEIDEERLILTIGSTEYNVTGISFSEEEGSTRAILDMTEELLYHVDSETAGLLRLKIYGGKLNTLKFSATEGKGLFNRVRAERTEHDAYLFFDVTKTAARFRVEFLEPEDEGERGRQLVIYLEQGELPEIPDADFAGKRMTEILDSAEPGTYRELRKVVIDPGHGGIDKGKISPSGVYEKDVNLALSFDLKDRLIEDLGVEVILTRTRDELIALDHRAEIANSEGADLFISIHCNGWFHPDAGGFETFFLSPARTEDAIRLAQEENASLRFENPGLEPKELEDLDFILWDMVQNEFINESSKLAELIQRELSEAIEIRNRGVKQAGLLVLKSLKMPAVLIEVAFLSNPQEERLLQDSTFRRQVVEGIVAAVRRFQRQQSGVEYRDNQNN